uniref:Uncharacterized protein n=1 Tax=Glossina austeni TaxID=7395 RepID=A0A1A9VWI0_GLOAU
MGVTKNSIDCKACARKPLRKTKPQLNEPDNPPVPISRYPAKKTSCKRSTDISESSGRAAFNTASECSYMSPNSPSSKVINEQKPSVLETTTMRPSLDQKKRLIPYINTLAFTFLQPEWVTSIVSIISSKSSGIKWTFSNIISRCTHSLSSTLEMD